MKKIMLIVTTLFIAPLLVGFSHSLYEDIKHQKDEKEKLKIKLKAVEESYYNSFSDVFGYSFPPMDSLEEKKQLLESQRNYYTALIHLKEQLSVLSADKELFYHLSNPMQNHLSKFILDIEEELIRDHYSISTEEISKNMINISKQEECFRIEWRYQNGEIKEEAIEKEIDNILYPGYRNSLK